MADIYLDTCFRMFSSNWKTRGKSTGDESVKRKQEIWTIIDAMLVKDRDFIDGSVRNK